MKVLLIDDDPFELDQLKHLIKTVCPHWHLFAVQDGPTALNLASKIYFDIAFVDINLPAQTDLTTARMLRQSGGISDIVIVTAHQEFTIAYTAIKIGVTDFLIKPISAADLNPTLARFLQKEGTRPVYSPLVNRVLAIVEQHYAARFSLADAAAFAHVNPSYLSRRFKAEVGQSFSEYLADFCINKVKNLLVSHPELSIAQIAEKTGFASQQYLSTIFHRKIGLTPREYRKYAQGRSL